MLTIIAPLRWLERCQLRPLAWLAAGQGRHATLVRDLALGLAGGRGARGATCRELGRRHGCYVFAGGHMT
ncbi:MAG: hypothetical protein HY056_02460 [Proteobacteria bacterium]|nr:hypothetical protein [Pseudomonadota bacterium]